MGKQKSVKKRKLPDIKSLIFGNGHKEGLVDIHGVLEITLISIVETF